MKSKLKEVLIIIGYQVAGTKVKLRPKINLWSKKQCNRGSSLNSSDHETRMTILIMVALELSVLVCLCWTNRFGLPHHVTALLCPYCREVRACSCARLLVSLIGVGRPRDSNAGSYWPLRVAYQLSVCVRSVIEYLYYIWQLLFPVLFKNNGCSTAMIL